MKALRFLFSTVLECLYPSYCQICTSRTAEQVVVCKDCALLFKPQQGTFCLNCAEQVHHSALLEHVCVHCKELPFSFDFVVAAYVMNPYLRHCIHVFKYKKGTYLLSFLSTCLERAFLDKRLSDLNPQEWVLTSVPVHHIRERERGFDQSQLLAERVSHALPFSYLSLLERISHTPHQAQLNKRERALNIKRAFSLKDGVTPPQNVMLIDDVFTTGATVNACTKVLKAAGVKRVIIVCLARR